LGVWPNSAPNNSEKFQTKLNGPHCIGVCKFKFSNWLKMIQLHL
jgi:hypothetical protein